MCYTQDNPDNKIVFSFLTYIEKNVSPRDVLYELNNSNVQFTEQKRHASFYFLTVGLGYDLIW